MNCHPVYTHTKARHSALGHVMKNMEMNEGGSWAGMEGCPTGGGRGRKEGYLLQRPSVSTWAKT